MLADNLSRGRRLVQQSRHLFLEQLESRFVPAALPLVEVIYLSTESPGSVINNDDSLLRFDDSDVLRLSLARAETGEVISYRYEMFFDGSDVGLDGDGEDIDALAILPGGRLAISTTGRATVTGLTAEDEDLLVFTPDAGGLGFNTAGTWSLLFNGSDVGLTADSEDIDALDVLDDGRLVISTLGDVGVSKASGRGEDLLVFTPFIGGLGPTTRGTWAKFLDGSNIGLAGSTEKVDALAIQDAALVHLSTNGAFSVAGAAGQDEDLVTFDRASNAFVPGLHLAGSQVGLANHDIDALEIGPTLLDSLVLPSLPTIDANRVLSVAQTKLAAHDARSSTEVNYPRENAANVSTWTTVGPSSWEAGFYPGALWLMYGETGDPAWLARAQAWTAGLEGRKNDTTTHDVGFVIGSSFGQGYRLTGESAYQDVMLAAARSLSSRYDPDVGAIRSWNGGNFQVIIDNMMNLELLFWAAAHGGTTATGGRSQDLYDMAVSHATQTLANHVRPDGSTYHVVDYSPTTGAVLRKYTAQGKSDESTWSRGQAWAVYGFSMTFRETGDPKFLDAARRTADYFLAHLPDDWVPPADFQSTYTDLAHKDSSAAAIAASALIELSQLETDPARSQRYWNSAVQILDALASPTYFAATSANAGLLLHGSRSYPGDNRSYMFGDYYFLEAVTRYWRAVQG